MRTYKVEINPTEEQKNKINRTIGTCRYIYNFYIEHNKKMYEKEGKFISGMDFSKWLNNEYLPNNEDLIWIKEVSSKAVKQSIMNGQKSFNRFFKKESKFPRFKKKNKSDVKAYFPKNNNTDWTTERHRVKIPTLGYIKLKEKGYIPYNADVISGTVSKSADRYYVSVLVKEDFTTQNDIVHSEGVGIDLGIKEFAALSNGKIYKNINKTTSVKKLEKKLKRAQRKLSRKYESRKKRNNKKGKGEATRQNLNKQTIKVQKIYQKLKNIRQNYVNQIVSELVRTKPIYITIEDLKIKNMIKNRCLSKAIQQQNFYYFRVQLTNKCKQNNIELRIVNTFYPSSKLCSCCSNVNKDLTLKCRTYICLNCNLEIDRDLNASINLKNAKEYNIS